MARRQLPAPIERGGRLAVPACLLATILGVTALTVLPTRALAVLVTPDRPPASGLPWLEVSSGLITNSQGQTVILRGFNDAALLETGANPLPPALSNADALLMEAEGFDVVRIPISWSLLEPQPGHFSTTYLDEISAMVSVCAAHHLYAVLDMHTEDFGVGFGGSGAPAWLRVPGIPNLHLPGLPAAWQRHLSPAVNAALAYFWLYPNWQALYWQAWAFVAQRFRGNSNLAGYDLYNEPHPLPIPPGIFATRLLWPFYATGIKTLSAVDPNHLFIVEGDLFGEYPTAITPLHAADLVYSTHLYAGSLLGSPFKGSAAPLKDEWNQALGEARQLPAPYWVGEVGINRTQPLATQWAEDEIALSNTHLAGWAWWEWDDSEGWGVRQNGGPVDAPWLHVLSQPFIRSAPGRLTSMSFQLSTGVLRATISGALPGSLVQVSWPKTAGSPALNSSCVRELKPHGPSPGLVTLVMVRSSCRISLGSQRPARVALS
ncbi:MAG TPA: cellulase family glycosylhydrolase [Candidatus Dormibacteraeota bacterium]|nr:cellulase family glycosylhydrolase [Candidatus Dormibacteraeota bacterium]